MKALYELIQRELARAGLAGKEIAAVSTTGPDDNLVVLVQFTDGSTHTLTGLTRPQETVDDFE